MHLKDTSSDGFLFHKTNEVRLDLQSYQKMVHIIHRRIWSYSHENLQNLLSNLNRKKFRKKIRYKQKNLPRALIAVNQPDQCRSLTCAISSLWFISFLSEFIIRNLCQNCCKYFIIVNWVVHSSLVGLFESEPPKDCPTRPAAAYSPLILGTYITSEEHFNDQGRMRLMPWVTVPQSQSLRLNE